MTAQRVKVAAAIGFGLLGLVAGKLIAAPAAASAPKAQSGHYKLESSHARVLFSVSHAGFSTWYGEFTGASGLLDLDASDPKRSSLAVSMKTADVTTNNAVLDGELQGAKWFDATRYPTISFTSRRVVDTGTNSADVIGDLTMHGITKPITLHTRFNKAGISPFDKNYTVGFEVSGTVKRGDFGVSEYIPLVGDDVTLIISAPFEKIG